MGCKIGSTGTWLFIHFIRWDRIHNGLLGLNKQNTFFDLKMAPFFYHYYYNRHQHDDFVIARISWKSGIISSEGAFFCWTCPFTDRTPKNTEIHKRTTIHLTMNIITNANQASLSLSQLIDRPLQGETVIWCRKYKTTLFRPDMSCRITSGIGLANRHVWNQVNKSRTNDLIYNWPRNKVVYQLFGEILEQKISVILVTAS